MKDPGPKKVKVHMYLVYLFLISLMLTGISFSRFSTVIHNSGPENIVIPEVEFSAWILDHQADSVNLEDMQPGSTRIIPISITNQNESEQVSGYNQSVTLELRTTGNLPLQYALSKAGSAVSLSQPDSNRYVSQAQEFTANVAETKSYQLTIVWPPGSKSDTYKNEIDYLQLQLRAVQS
jgi:hypothetical protein